MHFFLPEKSMRLAGYGFIRARGGLSLYALLSLLLYHESSLLEAALRLGVIFISSRGDGDSCADGAGRCLPTEMNDVAGGTWFLSIGKINPCNSWGESDRLRHQAQLRSFVCATNEYFSRYVSFASFPRFDHKSTDYNAVFPSPGKSTPGQRDDLPSCFIIHTPWVPEIPPASTPRNQPSYISFSSVIPREQILTSSKRTHEPERARLSWRAQWHVSDWFSSRAWLLFDPRVTWIEYDAAVSSRRRLRGAWVKFVLPLSLCSMGNWLGRRLWDEGVAVSMSRSSKEYCYANAGMLDIGQIYIQICWSLAWRCLNSILCADNLNVMFFATGQLTGRPSGYDARVFEKWDVVSQSGIWSINAAHTYSRVPRANRSNGCSCFFNCELTSEKKVY